mmetsp:Transcript_35196/g.53936  ORF Transcript_35196/g.53936 Transcript_35196/m.53936 type:complete len:91 (-) Transcript_35196:13-285(-)
MERLDAAHPNLLRKMRKEMELKMDEDHLSKPERKASRIFTKYLPRLPDSAIEKLVNMEVKVSLESTSRRHAFEDIKPLVDLKNFFKGLMK